MKLFEAFLVAIATIVVIGFVALIGVSCGVSIKFMLGL